MTTGTLRYDHPAYIARLAYMPPALAAGASGATSKFCAFADMKVMAIVANTVTAGTSTYTAWNGTATVTPVLGDTVSGIRVSATTTTTYGPFTLGTAAGQVRRIELGTSTGAGQPTGGPGLPLTAGDTFHLVRGTDATAVNSFSCELQIATTAALTITPGGL
jgi:hypothetical protein